MKHEEYLVELLRPLGVYDMSAGSVNRGELAVYGGGLDIGFDRLEEICREMSLATARGQGLDLVEELLPYRPVSDTQQGRGAALAALLRIGGDSFTPEAINDTLLGCGIHARAAEGGQPGYVEVSFPDVKGIPAAFEGLRAIIEEILPCHLEVTYLFWFNTWAETAAFFPTWGDAAEQSASWYELSVWR